MAVFGGGRQGGHRWLHRVACASELVLPCQFSYTQSVLDQAGCGFWVRAVCFCRELVWELHRVGGIFRSYRRTFELYLTV